MSPRGIPPSLDRAHFRTTVILFSLLMVGAAVLLLVVTTAGPGTSALTPLLDATPGGLDPIIEEYERASAYQALRDHLDSKYRPTIAGVVNLYCRDSRHRVLGRYFEFLGDLDLEYGDGTLKPMTYIATLGGSSHKGWEILSLAVEEAPALE